MPSILPPPFHLRSASLPLPPNPAPWEGHPESLRDPGVLVYSFLINTLFSNETVHENFFFGKSAEQGIPAALLSPPPFSPPLSHSF